MRDAYGVRTREDDHVLSCEVRPAQKLLRVVTSEGRLLRAFWSVDILPSRRPAGTFVSNISW